MKKFQNLSLILFITAVILISVGIVKAVTTINLNQADDFAVLAGSGITFTGAVNSSNVTGDIGSYPTLTINGIGNVVLTGTSSASSTVAVAKTALTQAYIDAASSTPATTITSDLGTFNSGTLLPGVYNSGSSIDLTGTLTLDAKGNPNAVFIFQAGSTLTTASNSIVKLINGAQACKVFWQVGSSATLGTYSTFKGNILASDSITDNGYSNIFGRVLAKNAAVTLNNTTLIKATCGTTYALHVIKNVVGGTAVPTDFTISVTSGSFSTSTLGTSTPGTAYSLLAGTYTVSEAANSSYTKIFSDGCNSSGQVDMDADKTCTITNTYITPIIVPVPSSGGSSGPVPVVPVIGIIKVPDPLFLASGSSSGLVTYHYKVWNVGRQRALVNITVVDDKCGPVTLISGDLNQNYKIESDESWNYTCTTNLTKTTTNTAVATGYSDDPYHQVAIATAIATVVVGSPEPPMVASTTNLITPIISIVKVPSLPTPSSTVLVSTPDLPNAGLAPNQISSTWNIIIPIAALFLILSSLFLILKKNN